jgi:hypothetical protein
LIRNKILQDRVQKCLGLSRVLDENILALTNLMLLRYQRKINEKDQTNNSVNLRPGIESIEKKIHESH